MMVTVEAREEHAGHGVIGLYIGPERGGSGFGFATQNAEPPFRVAAVDGIGGDEHLFESFAERHTVHVTLPG